MYIELDYFSPRVLASMVRCIEPQMIAGNHCDPLARQIYEEILTYGKDNWGEDFPSEY